MITELSYTNWSNIYVAQHQIHEWANKTFPGRAPSASLSKLVLEEIPELLTHLKQRGPEDIGEEFADCLILMLDLAAIWGVDVPQALKRKMLKNASREWVKNSETGFYNHVHVKEL